MDEILGIQCELLSQSINHVTIKLFRGDLTLYNLPIQFFEIFNLKGCFIKINNLIEENGRYTFEFDNQKDKTKILIVPKHDQYNFDFVYKYVIELRK